MNKTSSLKKTELDPCAKCKGTNFGKEKTYQDFKDIKTGETKEIHTGYLTYCKDCVNRSMKAMKYKTRIWDSLNKNLRAIKELESEEELERFKKCLAESIKEYPQEYERQQK